MRFVVAGGGTGGHIYPALAIARGLNDRYPGSKILYIGTTRGMEADIVPKAGLPFQGISAAGLERKLSVRNLLVLWQAGRGFLQALRIIKGWRPELVIGTGGYVCGPVVLAAALCHAATLIHEQNAFPGVTNRILSRFAGQVAVTFADSVQYFPRPDKVRLTGLPVRPEILAAEREEARRKLRLPGDRLLVFSFGGSRGAFTLNEAMVQVIKLFANDPRLNIFHVTGNLGHQKFLDSCAASGINLGEIRNVTIASYLYQMEDILAAADLVIGRAGAATLAELTALGIPSILIPYPYASENHQEFNARALEKEKAALVVLDHELSGTVLGQTVTELVGNRERLLVMGAASKNLGKRRALEEIMDCAEELIKIKK
ncbi:MAG: UDP-N-acetylglucosamine--N-acetylmuramyl-(pentapeptide) pyrophosphoryl-undecaprenol N-acetylglucosamine transferase [Pelotomaculum sp. PtaB.Bin104]|nr:MAG: UDP-N-acetylglucosamine--N-acetylmuramyl-(pentapeptide) pyrophosphoryl-undecaprenol N-acetylglucosamine transferase [Pelotomaculum sp. PtaB.Bin104]